MGGIGERKIVSFFHFTCVSSSSEFFHFTYVLSTQAQGTRATSGKLFEQGLPPVVRIPEHSTKLWFQLKFSAQFPMPLLWNILFPYVPMRPLPPPLQFLPPPPLGLIK
ncbi:uncharacterized protein LOC132299951 [Cornus florida]|uniref:uncharacterized protein LOC132299951 n=1 Tax=Cornus florida TaxID=4283 RepID=UPI00289C5719|nr:uncharacterized protein LOC132299951 [Cornus florida]